VIDVSEFSEPVAAASIAQVHSARLLADTGVKWRSRCCARDVERAFRRDIDAFYLAAGVIEWLLPSTRRLRPLM
jgi:ubiquinone biosynthesis protein